MTAQPNTYREIITFPNEKLFVYGGLIVFFFITERFSAWNLVELA